MLSQSLYHLILYEKGLYILILVFLALLSKHPNYSCKSNYMRKTSVIRKLHEVFITFY